MFRHLQIAREATLAGGPSIWWIKSVLFVIESRTAHFAGQARPLRAFLIAATTLLTRIWTLNTALDASLARFYRPTFRDLERYADRWAIYVPREPAARAALAHLLSRRYPLTTEAIPNIRAALGLDTEAVRQAYQHLYGQPLTTVFVPPRRPSRPSIVAVFRHRAFTLLWLAQLISVAGSALTQLAAGMLIYRLTGSALSLGALMIALALPSLLIGPFAGVFADRWDRKRIMIAADLIRAVLIIAIPIVLPFGLVWLYVIVILSSGVGQFFDPAHASVLPETALDDELAAANAFMTISAFGSTAIGFAAAGLIASQFPIEWAFYLDALTFVISAVCILQVHTAPLMADGRTTVATVVHNLRNGAGFLMRTRCLRSLFLVYLPIFLSFGYTTALTLPFMLRALRATEFAFGLLSGLESIGLVLGSLWMARVADRLREGQWVALSFLGMGLAYALFALASSVPLAIAIFAVSGALNAPSVVGRQLLIQRNTPREMRGRVNSAFFVARDVEFASGMAAAGLADLFDVRVLFFIGALVVLCGGLLAFLLPGLREPWAAWRRAIRLARVRHLINRLF